MKKFIKNHVVSLMLVLPNIAISAVVQFLSLIVFHLTGFQAFLLYFVGAGLGFEWGVLFAIFSRSNFKVGKWEYHYGPKTKKPSERELHPEKLEPWLDGSD